MSRLVHTFLTTHTPAWLVCLALAACGGSGGGDAPSAPTAPPQAPGEPALLAGHESQAGCVDGPAINARFSSPQGLALDANGELLVADPGCSAIRRVARDGTVSTFAGRLGTAGDQQGPREQVRLRAPFGVAIEPGTGNVFVTDNEAHRMLRIQARDGAVVSLMGTGSAGATTVGVIPAGQPGAGTDPYGLPRRRQDRAALDRPTFIAPMAAASAEGEALIEFVDAGNQLTQQVRREPSSTPVIVSSRDNCQGLLTATTGTAPLICSRSTTIGASLRDGQPTITLAGRQNFRADTDGIGDQARFLGSTGLAQGPGTRLWVADRELLRQIDIASGDVRTVLRGLDRVGTPRQIVLSADGRTLFFTTPTGIGRVLLP